MWWLILPLVFGYLQIAVAAEEIRIVATQGAVHNIFKKIQEPFEKQSGIKLIFIGNNGTADDTFIKFSEGRADIAVAVLSKDAWFEALDNNKVKHEAPETYNTVVVGRDRLQIYVNTKNPIRKLEKSQIEAIFTGRAKNWNEISHAGDLVITVLTTPQQKNTDKVFRDALLDGKAFASNLKSITTSKEMMGVLAQTSGGVAFAPLGALVPGTVAVDYEPVIKRPITVMSTAQNRSVGRLLQFIREKGESYGVPQ